MPDKRIERYHRIQQQLAGLFHAHQELLSRMSTINALLYHKFTSFSWVGFYLLLNEKLVVGPYQGPLACLELEKEKGVCWKGIISGQPVLVADVNSFPGHIACDPRSRSEIVLPVFDLKDKLIGVLDVDSNEKANFNDNDRKELQKIIDMMFR